MCCMRLAFVDLLFSWPPHGGACTDAYYTARELQHLGHDVCLFMLKVPGQRERAAARPGDLPFPSATIEVPAGDFDIPRVMEAVRAAVDSFAPESVVIGDAFFAKPHLAKALAHYPQAWRYYAYEASCPRDHRRFLQGQRCENDYFSTPDICRTCAVEGMAAEIRSGVWSPWVDEFVATRADRVDYYAYARDALAKAKAVIVYNDIQRDLLQPINPNIHVVPGGVDIDRLAVAPANQSDKAIILMTGRCEDHAKGLSILMEAGKLLAAERHDFEIWATLDDPSAATDFFKPVGWKSHDEAIQLCNQSTMCVVPSLWHEPFGMVAVEAMAAGRPALVADGGGLSSIVDHGETGYVYPATDATSLANYIATLLDDRARCERMGQAARARAESHYTWSRVVGNHYSAIIEALRS